MAYLDLSSANAALKELIDDQTLQRIVYERRPFMAMIPKNERAGGMDFPLPIRYGNAQGRSSNFQTAQKNQTAPPYARFLLTRKRDYGVATIDNETLEASLSDKGAFAQLGMDLIKSSTNEVSNSVSSASFRSGTGSIGNVSSTVPISTGVIKLQNPADIVNFSVGQTLQATTTDGGSPHAALGYVVAVSIRNGTITVSDTAQGGAPGTPAGWTLGNFLVVEGDLNAKPQGLQAWLPMTDPGPLDNFFGVNRSVSYRLYGVQYDGSGEQLEEALVNHIMLLSREDGYVSHYFTNYGSLSGLVNAMGTRVVYEDIVGPADIAFQSVRIIGPSGPIRIIADRNCPPKRGFALDLEDWVMISIGPVPKILKYDENTQFLRVVNDDASECRVGAYYNIGCRAPGRSGQTILST